VASPLCVSIVINYQYVYLLLISHAVISRV